MRRRRLFADTAPLRTPDFRRLWLAGIVTVIGGGVLAVIGVVLASVAVPAFVRYRVGPAKA